MQIRLAAISMFSLHCFAIPLSYHFRWIHPIGLVHCKRLWFSNCFNLFLFFLLLVFETTLLSFTQCMRACVRVRVRYGCILLFTQALLFPAKIITKVYTHKKKLFTKLYCLTCMNGKPVCVCVCIWLNSNYDIQIPYKTLLVISIYGKFPICARLLLRWKKNPFHSIATQNLKKTKKEKPHRTKELMRERQTAQSEKEKRKKDKERCLKTK